MGCFSLCESGVAGGGEGELHRWFQGRVLGVVRLGVSHLVAPEVNRPFLEAFLCARPT